MPGSPEGPAILLTSDEAMIDERVGISLMGLRPDRQVELRASFAFRGRQWTSHASFVSDRAGQVDVTTASPVAGTYEDADGMGLFWSARPVPGARRGDDESLTHLSAAVEGDEVATAALRRLWARPGVRRTSVRDGGLVAELFEPAGPGPYPAVLCLGGSEGGIGSAAARAAALASHGIVAFAIAYFGVEGLPRHLSLIPLEYFEVAVEELRGRPSVDSGAIGVVGASRGGELALLLASGCPALRAVIAYTPSDVVVSEVANGLHFPRSGWSRHGHGLPFLPQASQVSRSRRRAEAEIPVHDVRGAVMIVSGKRDRVWPAADMGARVVQRLADHGHPYPCEHLCYPDAGHAIGRPFVPGVLASRLGGTPEGNARADEHSWPRVLAFLHANLGQVPPA